MNEITPAQQEHRDALSELQGKLCVSSSNTREILHSLTILVVTLTERVDKLEMSELDSLQLMLDELTGPQETQAAEV